MAARERLSPVDGEPGSLREILPVRRPLAMRSPINPRIEMRQTFWIAPLAIALAVGVVIYAVRLDRGASPKDVLAEKPGVRWAEESGLTDVQYIVPGGGGFGKLWTQLGVGPNHDHVGLDHRHRAHVHGSGWVRPLPGHRGVGGLMRG